VAKGAEVREVGILQRLMMKLRMLAEHGSLELLIIDFVYYTTDIVSGKQVQFVLLCFLRSGF
jgi:hypothetical protein